MYKKLEKSAFLTSLQQIIANVKILRDFCFKFGLKTVLAELTCRPKMGHINLDQRPPEALMRAAVRP